MGRLFLVCVGGALGSGARYLVGVWAAHATGPSFPTGTLLVNLLGSFLITLIFGISARTAAVSPNTRLFLTTGVMGGLTTYSTFNYDVLRLWGRGAQAASVGYLAVTLLGCLAAGLLGSLAAQFTPVGRHRR